MLIGGAGNDIFALPEAGGETVIAGSGDDRIGLGGNRGSMPDTCEGGAGRDTFAMLVSNVDEVDMRDFPGMEDLVGAGTDELTLVIGNELANHISTGPIESDIAMTVHGLGGNDTLVGGRFADALFGGDGDDVIAGGLGDDTLRGDGGNDAIGGNGGNDRIFGHGEDDDLSGGSGADRINGGAGADTFNGGAGNDRLFARDTLAEGVNGGDGDDSAQADDDLDALFSVEAELP